MIFTETPLAGAFVISLEQREDSRGFFARAFCAREFGELGLATEFVNTNVAYNHRQGTLRGLHYQVPPHEEAKLVRCTAGAVFDVIVDVRPGSATRAHWFGIELTAQNRSSLYVPPGFAHGYVTLVDGSEVTYQVSQHHSLEAERGIRFDDPALDIAWPVAIQVVSEKDRSWPPFSR